MKILIILSLSLGMFAQEKTTGPNFSTSTIKIENNFIVSPEHRSAYWRAQAEIALPQLRLTNAVEQLKTDCGTWTLTVDKNNEPTCVKPPEPPKPEPKIEKPVEEKK